MRSPKINKFVVNPEKRTVVAIAFPKPTDIIKELYTAKRDVAFMADFAMRRANPDVPQYNLAMEYKFTGIAKCMPEDAFDPEFGKELAKHKALYKYHEVVCKQYDDAIYLLMETVNHLVKLKEEHMDASALEAEAILHATKD